MAAHPNGGHSDEQEPGAVAPDGLDPAQGVHNWHKGSEDAQGIRRQLGKVNFLVIRLDLKNDYNLIRIAQGHK